MLRSTKLKRSWRPAKIILDRITNTWIPDSMGVRYSNGNKWLGGPFKYRTFWTINRLFSVRFSDHHLNTWPFDNRTQMYHLNTRLVQYSDGYCIYFMVILMQIYFSRHKSERKRSDRSPRPTSSDHKKKKKEKKRKKEKKKKRKRDSSSESDDSSSGQYFQMGKFFSEFGYFLWICVTLIGIRQLVLFWLLKIGKITQNLKIYFKLLILTLKMLVPLLRHVI